MPESVPLFVRAVLVLAIVALLGWWDVWRSIRRGANDASQRSLAYRLIVGCGLAGGMFGLLMDQVTCTISPDYFRVFKEIPAETAWQLRSGAANLGFAAGTLPGLICGACFAAAATISVRRLVPICGVLWYLVVPVVCFILLAPLMGWHQTANDPTGVRETLRLGDAGAVSRLLFVWGVHQAAYVAGFVGTVIATILLRRSIERE